MSDQSPQTTHGLAVLDTRVSAIERSVTMLLDRLDTQSTKVDAQLGALRDSIAASRVPQWPVIASFVGVSVVVITALWGAGINPIRSSIGALDLSVASLAREIKAELGSVRTDVAAIQNSYVRRDAYNDDRHIERQQRGAEDARVNTAIKDLDARLRALGSEVVPRIEHEAENSSDMEFITQMRADLQRQITQHDDQLNRLNAPEDRFKALEQQVQILQSHGVQRDARIAELLAQIATQKMP